MESMFPSFPIVAMAGLCLCTQLFADPAFTVSAVDQPPTGEFTSANAINDAGQIAGAEGFVPALFTSCFLANGGKLTFFTGGASELCTVKDINNSAAVTGTIAERTLMGPITVGFVYQSGVLTNLPAVNGVYPLPTAINNLGDVAGILGSTGFVQSQGDFRELPSNSTAYGINDQRLIVGETDTCPPSTPSCVNARHGFVFNLASAAVTDLGTLGGTNSRAIAINNSGQIVGTSDLAGGGSHAFLYESGVMRDLGSLGGDSAPVAINNAGLIIGNSSPSGPFLYLNGTMRSLNDLIPAGSGWRLQQASGINSSGQIVGTGLLNGQQVGFLLTPVISPSTSGLRDLGGPFSSRPVVARNIDGRLEAFVRCVDNSVYHAWQLAPGAAWSSWESLGGFISDAPAVIADNSGRLVIFATAQDHTLWYRKQNVAGSDNWSEWAGLGGWLTSAPAAALNADGRIDVAARGGDDTVWEIVQTSAGGEFGAWRQVGGLAESAPVLASDSAGRLHLFVTGENNMLLHNSQAAANGDWQPWSSLGGGVMGAPSVVLNSAGLLEVYAHGTDKALWRTAQFPGVAGWSELGSLGGVLAYGPAAAVNTDGRVEVFGIGAHAGLWHISQTAAEGGWSTWSLLGGDFNSRPAVARNADGRLAAMALGVNGDVYITEQFTAGNWQE
jgi:probable HAF family extracellular repeat protein